MPITTHTHPHNPSAKTWGVEIDGEEDLQPGDRYPIATTACGQTVSPMALVLVTRPKISKTSVRSFDR